MHTHTLIMRVHVESMLMHTHPNPNLENKNIVDRNYKSSNLACLKTIKQRKPKLNRHVMT